jgi:hypothetical protein
MMITIVAPEFITAQAYAQWVDARRSILKMHGFGFDIESWTMAHGFFASMGGFFIRFDDGTSYTLDLRELEWCFENGHFSSHDISISEAEIEDRSKSSTFTKVVTCGQSLWLVLQCIARAGQHLPTSRLELATCAYVACSLVTWCFWLKKPLDVDQQTTGGPVLKQEVLQQMQTALPKFKHPTGRVPTQGAILPNRVAVFGVNGVGVLFGAIHCIAWSSDFPSSLERFLWRLFATLCAGSSALLLFLFMPYYGIRYIEGLGDRQISMWEYWISLRIMPPLWLLYLASRFYLLFAIFYTLRAMPVEVYKTVNWIEYAPYFS